MPSVSKEELVEGFRIQTIQGAALRVISRRGLAAATMQEIAAEAGVAKGTLYLYFKSRDDLVQRTADLAVRQLVETLERTLADGRPLPEQLRALVEAKLKFFDTNREFFRLYLALCQGDVERPSRTRRRHQRQYQLYLERLTAFFRAAGEQGSLRPVDPFRLALFVAEGMNAIILRRLSEEPPPAVDSEVEWVVGTLLEGISKQGHPS
jgi:TetR/AcrR family fatty acid metabolism transcriptional regulator